MRARVRARREDYRYFHIPFSDLSSPPCHQLKKTTRRFQQNDTLVSTKRHVVFIKTTRHFQQNNTSFSTKQRVVFRGKRRNGQRRAEKESTQTQTIFFHSVREILQIGFEAQKHTLHLGRILTGKIMFQIGIGGFVIKA